MCTWKKRSRVAWDNKTNDKTTSKDLRRNPKTTVSWEKDCECSIVQCQIGRRGGDAWRAQKRAIWSSISIHQKGEYPHPNRQLVHKLKAEWDKFGSEYCNLISANTEYTGINESEPDTEGLKQVSRSIHHHIPLLDDCHTGWVELRIFSDTEDSQWSLIVHLLISRILTEK
ncbi:hypothetical protein NQZ68_008466 [Dissostichus eleginoides]|nr:hypothetical protein NQZ68_008466 [Dissostichus eleginoides]